MRHANGSLYPAAIYLGGSNQTVVRAIDSDVVDLFLRAEWSGGGGGNNTSGGVTHTNAAALGSATQTGSITILIEPPEARALSEAGWWLDGPDRTTSLKKHGWRHSGLNEGTYNLNMTPLPGFEAPQPVQVDAETTVAHTYTYTYLVLKVETTSRTASGFTVTTAGKEGRVYTLETSRDLVGEPWSVVASEGPIGVDGKVLLTDNNVSMDKGFYRIRVTKP